MFKDDEDCNDKPVTISATIMNNYGNVTPPRKNPTFIRAKEWRIDSKVVSVKVSNMRVKKYIFKKGQIQVHILPPGLLTKLQKMQILKNIFFRYH